MYGRVFAKTAAGQEEIQARRMKLVPRLRSLLVMIDGRHTVGALLATLGTMGVTLESFGELESAGLIEAPVKVVPETPRGEESEMFWGANPPSVADPERMLELYKICNEVIRAHFGLRGLSYQLQLERVASIEDYVVLARSLYAGLKRVPDASVAATFKARIRPLLLAV